MQTLACVRVWNDQGSDADEVNNVVTIHFEQSGVINS
jgi:hypothetical protein